MPEIRRPRPLATDLAVVALCLLVATVSCRAENPSGAAARPGPGRFAADAIECTAEAFHRKIAECNRSCGKRGCATRTIRFACSGATIPIPADGTCSENPDRICASDSDCDGRCTPARFDRDDRVVTCDGLIVDGGANDITFELAPSCEADSAARDRECGRVEGGEWFLVLQADHAVVRNLTVRGFFEGIYTGRGSGKPGHFNTIENVTFERGCDDVYTNQQGSEGNVLRDSVVRECCHRGVSLKGNPPEGETPGDPDFFDSQLIDVTFESAGFNPVHGDRVGRHLLRGVTIHNDADDGPYACAGEAIHAFHGATLYLDDVTIAKGKGSTGCKYGVITRGERGVNELIITNSTIRDARVVGVAVTLDSRLYLEGTTVRDNGGLPAGADWARHYGGVNIGDTAVADLGGGGIEIDGRRRSSRGGNRFQGNTMARQCSTTTSRSCVEDGHCPPGERCRKGRFAGDVVNDTASPVTAGGNTWTGGAPEQRIQGRVVHSPGAADRRTGSRPVP